MKAKRKTPKKSKASPKSWVTEPILTNILKEEFTRFIEYHPAARVSLNLRKMLLEFMMYDGAVEALYLQDLIYDLDAIFNLLDVVQSESRDKLACSKG